MPIENADSLSLVTGLSEPADPWRTVCSDVAYESRRMRVLRDRAVNPGGVAVDYDWFATADQVRVAAVVDGSILVVEQHHYLVGPLLQLPGGRVEGEEGSLCSAQRELAEETGYRRGNWTSAGDLVPLPALSPMRVHLWIATDLSPGPADLSSGESDLRVHALALDEAIAAVAAGRVRCAPSATLILLAAATVGSGTAR